MTRAVKFILDAEGQSKNSGRYDQKPRTDMREVIRKACELFNFNNTEALDFQNARRATIICSPESFVEWQIWRNSAGFINRYRDLGVHFVEQPTPRPTHLILVERPKCK